MDAKQVGDQLVELCRKGGNLEAISTLYADDIVSVEAASMPGMPAEARGIDAVRKKNEEWMENHGIDSVTIEGPFPHGGDRFAVQFDYQVTPKSGPRKDQQMRMQEIAVYEVRDGKIVREEFYYTT